MSNTSISNIDVNFPIPGQDNDSQTFRDNFFNIKTSLEDISESVGNLTVSINAADLEPGHTLIFDGETFTNGFSDTSLLSGLADTNISNTLTAGDRLEFNGTSWINNPQTKPTVAELSGVFISNTLSAGQQLTYNGTNWTNSNLVMPLNGLTDVVINAPTVNQTLRYNGSEWINASQDVTIYSVTVDEISDSQEQFKINGTFVSNLRFFTFEVNKRYRFDLSHPSNAPAPLRFSTTKDTTVPTTITPYTTGVTMVGTAGQPGAYIEILTSTATPLVLYFYAHEANAAIDTSKIGAEYPIYVGPNQSVTINPLDAVQVIVPNNSYVLVSFSTAWETYDFEASTSNFDFANIRIDTRTTGVVEGQEFSVMLWTLGVHDFVPSDQTTALWSTLTTFGRGATARFRLIKGRWVPINMNYNVQMNF